MYLKWNFNFNSVYQFYIPGTEVPKATKLIAVMASLRPTQQPNCEAMSPMTAVKTPIMAMDTTKHAHPPQISVGGMEAKASFQGTVKKCITQSKQPGSEGSFSPTWLPSSSSSSSSPPKIVKFNDTVYLNLNTNLQQLKPQQIVLSMRRFQAWWKYWQFEASDRWPTKLFYFIPPVSISTVYKPGILWIP